MAETSQPRHGYGRYGYFRYGSGGGKRYSGEVPWYVATRTGNVRVDGLITASTPSPIIPGETVTYELFFRPTPVPSDDHLDRFKTVRDLLVLGGDVVTYDPPGPTASYREQHGQADGEQLVGIGPLAVASDASAPVGDLPPARDSIHDPRWAVVVGGEARSTLPDKHAIVELETVTIASVEDFATREAVRNARENNGF